MLDKEQQFLLQLIRSCEYHHLSEKQSIGCVNKILDRNISRRTYYNYKNKLYKDDIFNKLKESIYNSHLNRLSILLLNDDADSEVRAKVNELVAGQFPDKEKPSFILPSHYCDGNDDNTKGKLKDVLAKIKRSKKTEKLANDRLNPIPKNATIREESIKCGKVNCNQCPHGSYYYAYWKEKTKDDNKSKLRKKYLGVMDPRY